MPFQVAWTDAIGKPRFVEGFAAYPLGLRRDWRPERWELALGVWAEGGPIGVQAVSGEKFAERRRVVTGSWLGERFQGMGYGTEMRGAVLELAFGGLGAQVAVSGHAEGNRASRRLSEKHGYEPAGHAWVEPRGIPVRQLKLELTAVRWAGGPRPDVELEGVEPCLPLFGL
jgi:RimJ/RimL family protein N-acetyltransferase